MPARSGHEVMGETRFDPALDTSSTENALVRREVDQRQVCHHADTPKIPDARLTGNSHLPHLKKRLSAWTRTLYVRRHGPQPARFWEGGM